MQIDQSAAGAGSLSAISEFITALSAIAWPFVAILALWRLGPLLREILGDRAFSLEVGGVKLSAEQIEQQFSKFQEQTSRSADAGVPDVRRGEIGVLWVDDRPENNLFEVRALQDRNLTVEQVTSTGAAMKALAEGSFDIVLSDMGRREGGVYKPVAGLTLLEAMRRAEHLQPFAVYTSPRHAVRTDDKVRQAGGLGAVGSPEDLFKLVGDVVRSGHSE